MPPITNETIFKMAVQGDREAMARVDRMAAAIEARLAGMRTFVGPLPIRDELDRAARRLLQIQQQMQLAANIRGARAQDLAGREGWLSRMLGRGSAQGTGEPNGFDRFLAGQRTSRPPTRMERISGFMQGYRVDDQGNARSMGLPAYSKILGWSFAIRMATRSLTDFTNATIKTQAGRAMFNSLSEGADKGIARLTKYRDAVKGMISDEDIMRTVSMLSQRGDVNDEKLPQMMLDISRIGRVKGFDSATSMNRLQGAIATGSNFQLDKILSGLEINRYIKEWIENTESDLTVEEVQNNPRLRQKIIMMAIDQAIKATKQELGPEALEGGDKLANFEVQMANIGTKFRETVANSKQFQDALGAASKFAESLGNKLPGIVTGLASAATSGVGSTVLEAGMAARVASGIGGPNAGAAVFTAVTAYEAGRYMGDAIADRLDNYFGRADKDPEKTNQSELAMDKYIEQMQALGEKYREKLKANQGEETPEAAALRAEMKKIADEQKALQKGIWGGMADEFQNFAKLVTQGLAGVVANAAFGRRQNGESVEILEAAGS